MFSSLRCWPAPPCDNFAEKSKKETAELLKGKQNSSQQMPGLSKLHNEQLADSPRLNLLSIPVQTRKQILRLTIVEDDPIVVDAEHPRGSYEPGILKVCHQIRNEGRPIFFKENDFELCIHSFGIKGLLLWMKKYETVCVEEDTDVKKENEEMKKAVLDRIQTLINARTRPVFKMEIKGTTEIKNYPQEYFLSMPPPLAPALGKRIWTVWADPHWANLVNWLMLYHAGEVRGYHDVEGAWEGTDKGVAGIFKVVESHLGREWSIVEEELEGLRSMLGAVDEEWLWDKA